MSRDYDGNEDTMSDDFDHPDEDYEEYGNEECEHECTETVWALIPGERVYEPDFDRCLACGAKV